ncbi:MAG: LarC family nickel insertion protein [Erysipelotrichaceae bacterium]|nr:LarC family nickel insertion protein [Erysipelotrichaceae bacterium]
MKIAYFDCSRGISGNRVIGTLLDAHVPIEYFQSIIQQLLPTENYSIDHQYIRFDQQTVTFFDVVLPEYHPQMTYDQRPKRNLFDIIALIRQSDLDEFIKAKSIEIFMRLGYAEADAHGCLIEEIDFHETGAIDTIIDVVCSVSGLHYLGIQKIISSPLNVGYGTINYRFGQLSIPAPATQRLIKDIPSYSNEVSGELVTPTGAAIITTLTENFGYLPSMTIDQVGFGLGKKEQTWTDCLKLYIGHSADNQ